MLIDLLSPILGTLVIFSFFSARSIIFKFSPQSICAFTISIITRFSNFIWNWL